jgi:hypothetical protein
MAEENGKGKAAQGEKAGDVEVTVARPGVYRISFEEFAVTKQRPVTEFVIEAAPEEIGMDPHEALEKIGLPIGSRIGLLFRAFEPGENAEIRGTVKDFPEDEWLQEFQDEICLRCCLDPAFPQSAQGRRQLQRWMPGFRASCASQVQQQSGLGVHTVKNAKEELGKLLALTPNTSST